MTQQADVWFVEKYNSKVTHVLQPQGWLMQGMFMPEGNLVGKKAYWPVFGTATAQEKQRDKATPEDVIGMSRVFADLKTYDHLAPVDDFDGSRMEASEENALADAVAKAMGRMRDMKQMDLLFNTAPDTPGTHDQFFDSSAGQLTAAQIQLAVAKWFGTQNIPTDGDVWAPVPMMVYSMLMADKTFSNSQYVGPDLPFKSRAGGARSWNFINWVIMPDSYFKVFSAAAADFPIFLRSGFGAVNNKRISSEWGRDISKGRWLVRHESEGTEVALLPKAVLRIRYKSNITSITAN